MSVRNYHYTLRNNPEESSSQLHVDLFLSIKLVKLFEADTLTMWIKIVKTYEVLFVMNIVYLATSVYMKFHIDFAYVYINI